MRWLLAAMTIALLTTLSSQGHAQATRVAIFKLEGPMGSRIRDQIAKTVGKDKKLELVELDDVLNHTGLRLAASADEIAKSEKLAEIVDVVVVGETKKHGRRWKLTIAYLAPQDGSELGRDNWSARRFAGLNVASSEIAERLRALVQPSAKEGPRDEDAENDNAWWEKDDNDENEDEAHDDDEQDHSSSEWPLFSVAGQVGSLRRDLEAIATVVNNGRNPAAPADAPFRERRSYVSKGLGHMEVGLQAEFYPGMLLEDPFPFLGVRARLQYGLFLSTNGCQDRTDLTAPCMPAQQFELGSSQYEIYLGARGRHRFDDLEGFTFFADLGWGHFGFGFDEQDLKQLERVSVVPSFEYDYLRLSLTTEYQVVPKLLAIGAEVGGHLGLGIGRQAKEVWGVESSGGSGWLLAVRANLEVADNVLLGVAFEYMTFSSTFKGQTACVEGDCASVAVDTVWEPWPFENNDPNAVVGGIADGVTDHYVRLAISVGTRL